MSSIEPVLVDGVGAGVILGRLHYVVLQPGDVGHEREPVGPVGLHSVGPFIGGNPLDGVTTDGPIIPQRVYRDMAALVIGRQQVAAGAVGRQESGRVFRRHRTVAGQPAGALVDGIAGNPGLTPVSNVEHRLVRGNGQQRRAARHNLLVLKRQRPGCAVHGEDGYLVVVLRRNINVSWHYWASFPHLGESTAPWLQDQRPKGSCQFPRR